MFKGQGWRFWILRLWEKVAANHQFLKNFSNEKLIYGINTGFGPMAQYKVSETNRKQLQYNLIRSHSSGGGKFIHPFWSGPSWSPA